MAFEQARQEIDLCGYTLIEDAVPRALCDDVVAAIDEFVAAAVASDPMRFEGLGIVPLHHHPAIWAVRQYPGLYDIFRLVHGRDDLWVSMDRVGYKPPQPDAKQHPVHWDCDPWTMRDFGVQGVLYLTDTDENQGAFGCVPSIYRSLDDWCEAHEGDEHRRHPDIGGEPLVRVPGPAGSLVLFHRLMPHTNTVNSSTRARYAQYVWMDPVGSESERAIRIGDYEQSMPPAWALRQKVVGQQVPEPGGPVPLSDLGRKLVGLDDW